MIKFEEFSKVFDFTSKSDSQIESAVSLDAMRCRYDVTRVNQGAAAHVDGFLRVLLQNSRLPRVFTELRVSIDVNRVLDSSVDALRVSDAASVVLALLLEALLLEAELLLLCK